MDIAAEQPRAPMLHGRRIDWTPRDVLFGALWAIVAFLAPLPVVVPFLGVYGENSSQYFVAALLTSMVSEIGLLLIAAYFSFRKYGGSWERLGFLRPTWATAGWGVAALVAAFVFSAAYGGVIEWFDIDALKSACDEQVPADVQNNAALLALASVIFVTFAPLCEEAFFRGFVFPGLTRWGVPVAVVLSAALFSLAHLLPKAMIPIFGIGVIFALTYWRSGNILSTMLAHFAYNIISVSTLWAGSCDPS